jgi:hypothetical protein
VRDQVAAHVRRVAPLVDGRSDTREASHRLSHSPVDSPGSGAAAGDLSASRTATPADLVANPELRDLWDFRIFVEIDFDLVLARGAARDAAWTGSAETAAEHYRNYYRHRERSRPHGVYVRPGRPTVGRGGNGPQGSATLDEIVSLTCPQPTAQLSPADPATQWVRDRFVLRREALLVRVEVRDLRLRPVAGEGLCS